ncbi:MAG: response regulator transcription factor [Nitrosomonadales bacterium]|nr:response regulator transcription factor [Nitrosomonadales bacterium]
MKILLVDDHVLFREGMRYVLQQLHGGVSEIFEAGNFPDGMKIAGQHPELDLALLNLNMPGSEGPISIKFFHHSYPHIPIVVVSGEESYKVMENAMDYGAMGFVCKNSAVPAMLNALNLVLSGEIYIPPQLLRKQGGATRKKAGAAGRDNLRDDEYNLTTRQRQALKHLTDGLSNKEIADKMCLTEGTVKVHIATLYQILDVHNRVEAARMAEKLKLIGSPAHG